jgi:hypothetical protein
MMFGLEGWDYTSFREVLMSCNTGAKARRTGFVW